MMFLIHRVKKLEILCPLCISTCNSCNILLEIERKRFCYMSRSNQKWKTEILMQEKSDQQINCSE